MSIVISTKEISNGEKKGEVFVKGHYLESEEGLLFFKGDIYNLEEGEFLFKEIIRQGINIIPQLKGEFFIVYYNFNSKKIYLANDKLGREPLFYFHDVDNFIISDDFWEIVNIIEPSISDIDIQSLKEFVIFCAPLSFKTIIKNLNYFPPASMGEYCLRSSSFDIKRYWDFKYIPDQSLSLDKAVDRLDRLFNDATERIKRKNAPNAKYGIGLSGGLDSRLIPYYAQRHNMNLVSFIIGERKPHKLILSRDHKNARKLARYYNLDHKEVEYDSESLDIKSFREIRYAPMKMSNFFINLKNTLPNFDILLTGMNGTEVLGTNLPSNISELDKEKLCDALIEIFSNMYITKNINFFKRLRYRWFDLLGNAANFNYSVDYINRRKSIDGVISKDEFLQAKSKVHKFIEENRDKTNLNIFQEYLFKYLVRLNKYSSLGSLLGRKRSYGIFMDPYFIDEALTWKPEFMINRNLQRHFFIKKFPELAKIPAQDFNVPIFYRDNASISRKVLAFLTYKMRGAGLRYNRWIAGKRYKEYSRKILLKRNSVFSNIFEVKKIINLDNKDGRMYENLVKFKQILDVIESKYYRNFFSNFAQGEKQK